MSEDISMEFPKDPPCDVPVFHPTMEEMQSFQKYLETIQQISNDRYGVCKIVPPAEWKEKLHYTLSEVRQIKIPNPIKQYVSGRGGVFVQWNVIETDTAISVSEFEKEAKSAPFQPKSSKSFSEIERMFWKNISFNPPTYGADMNGCSLFKGNGGQWNLNKLDTILNLVHLEYPGSLPGVTSSYLYWGMWKAMFAWHTEDLDLYSINFLHLGAPKFWYAVPPSEADKFEQVAQSYFPQQYNECSQFLRHKTSWLSPGILKQHKITLQRAVQFPGEFVVTFPRGYHAGFNLGFSILFSSSLLVPFLLP